MDEDNFYGSDYMGCGCDYMLNIYGFTSDEYQNKCRNDDNFLVSYDEYETTDCDWIETTLAENGSCDEECSSVSECYCRT